MPRVSALSLRSSGLTEVIYVGQGSFASKVSQAGTCLDKTGRQQGDGVSKNGGVRVCCGPAVGNRGQQISVRSRLVWDIQRGPVTDVSRGTYAVPEELGAHRR